jgi:hypothetical protein
VLAVASFFCGSTWPLTDGADGSTKGPTGSRHRTHLLRQKRRPWQHLSSWKDRC